MKDFFLLAAAAAALTPTLYYLAEYQQGYEREKKHVAEIEAKARAEAREKRLTFQRVPGSRSAERYGPPHNITIVCETTGSTKDGHGRKPLDLNAAPKAGDVYVRTCRAYANAR